MPAFSASKKAGRRKGETFAAIPFAFSLRVLATPTKQKVLSPLIVVAGEHCLLLNLSIKGWVRFLFSWRKETAFEGRTVGCVFPKTKVLLWLSKSLKAKKYYLHRTSSFPSGVKSRFLQARCSKRLISS
nr:hypothetical protein [Pseudodesulfovibrio sp.]